MRLAIALWDKAPLKARWGFRATPSAPVTNRPLVAVYGGVPWEPWSMDLANSRYLTELHRILQSP